jgi:hypothetical protein
MLATGGVALVDLDQAEPRCAPQQHRVAGPWRVIRYRNTLAASPAMSAEFGCAPMGPRANLRSP